MHASASAIAQAMSTHVLCMLGGDVRRRAQGDKRCTGDKGEQAVRVDWSQVREPKYPHLRRLLDYQWYRSQVRQQAALMGGHALQRRSMKVAITKDGKCHLHFNLCMSASMPASALVGRVKVVLDLMLTICSITRSSL